MTEGTESDLIETVKEFIGEDQISLFWQTAAAKADVKFEKRKAKYPVEKHEELRAMLLRHEVLMQLKPHVQTLVQPDRRSWHYISGVMIQAFANVGVAASTIAVASYLTGRRAKNAEAIAATNEGPFADNPEFTASHRPSRHKSGTTTTASH